MTSRIETGRFWTKYFRVYDKLAACHSYRHLMQEAVRFLEIEPGGKYLDLGCGTGNFMSEAARINPGIVGLDSSRAALRIAREKLAGGGFLIRANFENFPFRKGFEFDGVAAINSLYLAQDPQRVIRKIFEHLRPGGKLFITNPKKGASALAILKDEMRGAGMKRVLKANLAFMRLLPYQLVLKNEGRLESENFWREAVESAGGEVAESRFSYAGQNVTICAVKPKPPF